MRCKEQSCLIVYIVVAVALLTIQIAGHRCDKIPTPGTFVTLEACTDGLGSTTQWHFSPDSTIGRRIVLANDPSLCLDVECSPTLQPCVGGPDDDGIVWWGPAAQLAPCSTTTTTFNLFPNGSIGVVSTKPDVPAGLCLATKLVYDLKFGGRAVQASPCGVSPQNQVWNVTSTALTSSDANVSLVMASGAAAGFCATACENPPKDPHSFCPRYHPIRGNNVYDASGPLFDDARGEWHVFEDDGGWSHWRSKDLVHWDEVETSTNFSTDTGSLSPTVSGVYAHWPVVDGSMGNRCCEVVESARATDASLSRCRVVGCVLVGWEGSIS